MNWEIPDGISALIHPQMMLLEISSETPGKYLYILWTWQYSQPISPLLSTINLYFWKYLRIDLVSEMGDRKTMNIYLNKFISVYPEKSSLPVKYILMSITSTKSVDHINYLPPLRPIYCLEITQLNNKIFLIEKQSANFFCIEPDGKYLQLCRPTGPCHNYSILLL